MASSTFARVFVAGLSSALLVACTSALGNFTIDDSLDGGGAAKDAGNVTLADGASAVDGSGGGGPDAGPGTVDSGVKPPCAANAHYAFVTHEMFTGGFASAASGGGAIGDADAKCQAAAGAGKLPGTYKAWLSTAAPASMMPGSLPQGALFTPSCAMIKGANSGGSGKLTGPINEDQLSNKVVEGPVWTATKTDGSFVGGLATNTTCVNWTNALGTQMGVVGNVGATDDTWTDNGNPIPCSNKARLYCIQQ